MRIKYRFNAEVWQHNSNGGWYFVSLPADLSIEIRSLFGPEEEGWGRLKATAEIDKIQWSTAIWYDSKSNTYLLPLKADIRKKLTYRKGDHVDVIVYI